ncbi:MAG: HD domain-containing protein, partial [Flavisolibacter sp.]
MDHAEQTKSAEFQKAEAYIFKRLKKELSPTLSYHGYHHTEDVMNAAMQIAEAEKISESDKELLRIAVAFHDAGFIYIYQDHEERGCRMVEETLPSFGFSAAQIQLICGMIRATKIPQRPISHLEQIIADADLDYLGRDDVFPIAETLFKELKIYANLHDEEAWNKLQLNFLSSHHYHTATAKKLRTTGKEEYIGKLK